MPLRPYRSAVDADFGKSDLLASSSLSIARSPKRAKLSIPNGGEVFDKLSGTPFALSNKYVDRPHIYPSSTPNADDDTASRERHVFEEAYIRELQKFYTFGSATSQ
ncbi:hypothetical protein FOZ63_012974, partial [Perkinsus olseni]